MFLVRSKEGGLEVFGLADEKSLALSRLNKATFDASSSLSTGKAFQLSRDGRTLLAHVSEGLSVWTVDTTAATANANAVAFKHTAMVPVRGCQDFVLFAEASAEGTLYVATYERWEGETHRNLKVWALAAASGSSTLCLSLSHKNANTWTPQLVWLDGRNGREPFISRLVTNELHLFALLKETAADEAHPTPNVRLIVEGMSSVAFASTPASNGNGCAQVAVFSKECKGRPAAVRIYLLSASAKVHAPVAQKLFFKHADRCSFHWSPSGRHVLAQVQRDVDVSGQSYYGESVLIFLSADGSFDCRVELEGTGQSAGAKGTAATSPPIHDLAWRPDGSGFIVISGFMPTTNSVLYDLRCRTVFVFPCGAKNHVRFRDNRVCFGGFGNLQGSVETWTLPGAKDGSRQSQSQSQNGKDQRNSPQEDFHKLAAWTASNSTVCKWLTSDIILTATLTPRLRVDNGFRLWDARKGALLANVSIEELYQVECIGTLALERLASNASNLHGESAPNTASAPKIASKPVGAYRPPGLRNSSTPTLITTSNATGIAAVKVRRLQEKLSDVSKLKARRDAGETLDADASAKVAKESEFEALLAEALRAMAIAKK